MPAIPAPAPPPLGEGAATETSLVALDANPVRENWSSLQVALFPPLSPSDDGDDSKKQPAGKGDSPG